VKRAATLAFVVCALTHASDLSAQSAEVLAANAWRLHFKYTVNASLDTGEQQFDYSVTATGDGLLARDPNGAGSHTFSGDPSINVVVSYTGRVIGADGCGMMESLVANGLAICNPSTQMVIDGDEGTFELAVNCDRVPVVHDFAWLGKCGKLFDYPVDDLAITEWEWHPEAVSFGAMPRFTFPLPPQGATLSGSDSGSPLGLNVGLFTAIATGDMTPVDYQFDFTLTPEKDEVKLELDIPAYDRWRPSTTPKGDAGEPLVVNARLQAASGRPPRVAEFIWDLTKTSHEPGVAMNFPPDAPPDAKPDLRLGTPDDPHVFDADRQHATLSKPDGVADSMAVLPYDWGGWSTLTVTAVLEDNRRIVGKLMGASEEGARLPKRATTSYIADSWKESHDASGKADDADDEMKPVGDETQGDGLNLYQEYRGFYGRAEHREGDPLVKDLFLQNQAGSAATPGIGLFKQLSQLNVQPWLLPSELPMSRVINGNRAAAPAGNPQHAVIVAIDGSLRGLSKAQGGPGNPAKISKVRLQGDWSTVDDERWKRLVAHELFHTVNVWHHGDIDRMGVLWRVMNDRLYEGGGAATGTQIQVRQEKPDADITGAVIDLYKALPNARRRMWIAVDQGQHSGDDQCVMRYANSNAYVLRADTTKRVDARDERGSALCTSSNGTGVNEDPRDPQSRYGNAGSGRGNCAHQIHVTDAVPAPSRNMPPAPPPPAP
jgi:hypothetical protein